MRLVIKSGEAAGRTVEAAGDRFVIGRDPSADLVLGDGRVSRQHAFLRVRPDGRAEIHDLDSANGTFVNGHRLTGPVMLSGGEQLQFGDTVVMAERGAPSGPGTTQIDLTPPIPPSERSTVPRPVTGAPTPSTIERVRLRRSVRGAMALAALAVIVAAAVVVLFVTGTVGGGDDGDDRLSVEQVVERVTPSTVAVLASVNGERSGGGSGWVLDAGAGLIVTNQHVVNAGTGFAIGVGDANREATVVASAPCEDLALLRVSDTSGLTTLPLGEQASLRPGETVVAVGFPGAASQKSNLTTTTGVVSVAKTSFDLEAVDVPHYPNVVQTDAAINPGNSGGPLVDLEGRLVGVNSAGITLLGGRAIQGQGYAIGVDRVKEIMARLREGRSLGWTGMMLINVTDPSEVADNLQRAGLPLQPGLVVPAAVPATPAAEAGFGDEAALITAVNGRTMDGRLPTYCAAIDNGDSSDEAVFSVIRSGSTAPEEVRVAFAGAS